MPPPLRYPFYTTQIGPSPQVILTNNHICTFLVFSPLLLLVGYSNKEAFIYSAGVSPTSIYSSQSLDHSTVLPLVVVIPQPMCALLAHAVAT